MAYRAWSRGETFKCRACSTATCNIVGIITGRKSRDVYVADYFGGHSGRPTTWVRGSTWTAPAIEPCDWSDETSADYARSALEGE